MARAEYAAARILYDDGDFQGALTKLKSAFETSKDPRLLWNMAACEKNLRHYALSLGLVERYVGEGGALVSSEDRAAAEAFVETIRGFVADLTIDVNEPGAEITIDGQAVGTAPLPGPVKVDMGVHEIRVKKIGYVDFALSQDLPGGRAVGITATLVQERHEGKLRVVAGPQDAIQVDGKTVGTGLWEGVMPSGTHTVYVSAKGKLPYRTDVVVKDNFMPQAQDDPEDAWVPPYTAEEAGLEVFFEHGRWFASWMKLEEKEDLPEAARRELLVLDEDPAEPGRLVYRGF